MIVGNFERLLVRIHFHPKTNINFKNKLVNAVPVIITLIQAFKLYIRESPRSLPGNPLLLSADAEERDWDLE